MNIVFGRRSLIGVIPQGEFFLCSVRTWPLLYPLYLWYSWELWRSQIWSRGWSWDQVPRISAVSCSCAANSSPNQTILKQNQEYITLSSTHNKVSSKFGHFAMNAKISKKLCKLFTHMWDGGIVGVCAHVLPPATVRTPKQGQLYSRLRTF